MPNILDQVQSVGRECGTAYAISQLIAAETDPTVKKRQGCERRWQRWLNREGLKTLSLLEADLADLGYQIKIEKSKEKS